MGADQMWTPLADEVECEDKYHKRCPFLSDLLEMVEVRVRSARCREPSLAPSVSCSQRAPCQHGDGDAIPLEDLEEDPPFEVEDHGVAFASFAQRPPLSHQDEALPCLDGYKHD